MKQLLGEAALAYAHATGAQLYFHGEAVDQALAAQELLHADPGALSCEAVLKSAPALPARARTLLLVAGLGGSAADGAVSCPRFYRPPARTASAPPQGPPSITCPFCGAISTNPNDVRERYCGRCHAFIDDLLEGRAST